MFDECHISYDSICLFFYFLNLSGTTRPFLDLDLDATTDVLIIHISSHQTNKQNTIMFGLFSNSDAKKAELISLGLPEEAA